MYGWLKWMFVALCCAILIQYHRQSVLKLNRSRTGGSSRIVSSHVNITDSYEFYNRSEQNENAYLEFKFTVYSKGICGNLETPPLKRPCTPFLHVHYDQTEKFTVVQGQFSYRFGDNIYSCDSKSCPSPIIIPPRVPHTFWMNDNKEDLIVIVRVEPARKDRGLTATTFENIVGTTRDKHMNLWQAFVFIDHIETYPIALPLHVTKLIFRLGSVIGRLLGYQVEYEAYTTTVL